MKNNFALIAAVVAGAYFLWNKNKKEVEEEIKVTQEPLPTDSLQAGTAIPASQGVVKEGENLSFMAQPADWPYGY